jgi:hypothetical protein
VVTIGLKLFAWQLTGSVALLSDALESIVNLVAALIALAALRWAMTPPDERHLFGHEKAEYFSAGIEGGLILLAAASIAWVAVGRLIDPVALDEVGIGAAVGTTLVRLPAHARAGRVVGETGARSLRASRGRHSLGAARRLGDDARRAARGSRLARRRRARPAAAERLTPARTRGRRAAWCPRRKDTTRFTSAPPSPAHTRGELLEERGARAKVTQNGR